MDFLLFKICVFLYLAFPGRAASPSPSELYWNSVLPSTPMPKPLSDLAEGVGGYNHGAHNPHAAEAAMFIFYDSYYASDSEVPEVKDMTQVVFFFEKDIMQPGKTMKYRLARSTSTKPTFLSREAADSTPFSSRELPEILNKFSVKAGSSEARLMQKTIQICESQVARGEEKHCATSLESMLDFVTSKMGSNNIRAASTEVEKGAAALQNYTITPGVMKLVDASDTAGKVIVCHELSYGYAVFYCHKFSRTRAYIVPLKGADRTNAKAVAICHVDTSGWSQNNFAFKQLKVKPGTVPVCHFLAQGDIAWVSN